MKKMNVNIRFFGLIAMSFAITLLSLSSCGDFLDADSILNVNTDDSYKTKGDAEVALIGCYDGLQRIWGTGQSFPIVSEVCSDDCCGGGGNSDSKETQIMDEFDISITTSLDKMFQFNWEQYYQSVYRCNLLLSRLDQIDWKGDNAAKMDVEGQTRFIRAFLYFDMVRLWGHIPLVTSPTSANVPQAPAKDVYKVIAEDLTFAATHLHAPAWSPDWSAKNDGRATQWTAKALLARVYLFYTGYYNQPDLAGVVSKQDVLDGLEDLIQNGGFGLLSDYAQLFPAPAAYQYITDKKTTYAGKGNKETVFAIKYNVTSTSPSDLNEDVDGNHWLVNFGMRAKMFYPYSQGWGLATVSPALWKAFPPFDKRRNLSIISVEDENIPNPELADQREYTGYTNKKYTPRSVYDSDGSLIDEALTEGANSWTIGQYQDFVSIRFADVLLMAAELGSANAQAYFDQIRHRAYDDAHYVEKPATVENILNERRLEFSMEAIRYWDVLRQGIDNAATILSGTTHVRNGGAPVDVVVTRENILKTQGFQQIPSDQISLSNGMLKQNPGW